MASNSDYSVSRPEFLRVIQNCQHFPSVHEEYKVLLPYFPHDSNIQNGGMYKTNNIIFNLFMYTIYYHF